VTVWRTERRFGDDATPDPWHDRAPEPWHDQAPDPWHEDPPQRRALSPRDRFSTPVPISPPIGPPISPPVPAIRRPPPQPPAMRPPAQQPPAQQPPAQQPPAIVPPQPSRHGRRRTPRNRYDWRVTRHSPRPVEVVDDRRHFLATFGWTAAWFAVPYALFAAWTLTFPSYAGTACARPTGGACPSPRSVALTTLLDSLPRVAIALGIALVIAGLIRLGSTAWRPVTTAFAAAIIGAGTATVLYSVLNSSG
jgi:hypothetical protein